MILLGRRGGGRKTSLGPDTQLFDPVHIILDYLVTFGDVLEKSMFSIFGHLRVPPCPASRNRTNSTGRAPGAPEHHLGGTYAALEPQTQRFGASNIVLSHLVAFGDVLEKSIFCFLSP